MVFTIALILLVLVSVSATAFWLFLLGDPHRGTVKPGRPLSFLGHWLEIRYETFEMYEDERLEVLMRGKTQLERERIARKRRLNWYKPFGLCPICCNPYITTVFYALFWAFGWLQPHFLTWLVAVLISNTLLRLLLRII